MSRVLVTGGAGFVGSHICDRLLSDGHHVTSYDDLSAGQELTPFGCSGVIGSLAEVAAFRPNADVVVHCAARADVRDNWTNVGERQRLWETNIDGTIALLEAIGKTPVVFISTCAVYGDTSCGDPIYACEATSPYAASKLAGEALVQAYAFRHGLPWWVLRLGCVVGARYHHGHVADFVAMARTGKISAANDGNSRKSFVHVLDVADSVAACVDQVHPRGPIGGVAAGVYNLVNETWCPRDTVDAIGGGFSVEWKPQAHGWIGDPLAIAVPRMPLIPRRSIKDGVRDALKSLGWPGE